MIACILCFCIVTQTGLDEEIIKTLEEFHFDGDLLLLLTEENLKEDFNVKNGVTRRR